MCVWPAPNIGNNAMAVAARVASRIVPAWEHRPAQGPRVWSKFQLPSGCWWAASHFSAASTAASLRFWRFVNAES